MRHFILCILLFGFNLSSSFANITQEDIDSWKGDHPLSLPFTRTEVVISESNFNQDVACLFWNCTAGIGIATMSVYAGNIVVQSIEIDMPDIDQWGCTGLGVTGAIKDYNTVRVENISGYKVREIKSSAFNGIGCSPGSCCIGAHCMEAISYGEPSVYPSRSPMTMTITQVVGGCATPRCGWTRIPVGYNSRDLDTDRRFNGHTLMHVNPEELEGYAERHPRNGVFQQE